MRNVCDLEAEMVPLPDDVPIIWWELIPWMLDKDENQRISAEELLKILCAEEPSDHKTQEEINEASYSWKYDYEELPSAITNSRYWDLYDKNFKPYLNYWSYFGPVCISKKIMP